MIQELPQSLLWLCLWVVSCLLLWRQFARQTFTSQRVWIRDLMRLINDRPIVLN